jgi:hypothetical protein
MSARNRPAGLLGSACRLILLCQCLLGLTAHCLTASQMDFAWDSVAETHASHLIEEEHTEEGFLLPGPASAGGPGALGFTQAEHELRWQLRSIAPLLPPPKSSPTA